MDAIWSDEEWGEGHCREKKEQVKGTGGREGAQCIWVLDVAQYEVEEQELLAESIS